MAKLLNQLNRKGDPCATLSIPHDLVTKQFVDKEMTIMLIMLPEFWNKHFLEIDEEFSATKPKLCLIVGTLLYQKSAQHDIDKTLGHGQGHVVPDSVFYWPIYLPLTMYFVLCDHATMSSISKNNIIAIKTLHLYTFQQKLYRLTFPLSHETEVII